MTAIETAGYRHNLLFGVALTPDATNAKPTVERPILAEQVGLDLVSVSDHS